MKKYDDVIKIPAGTVVEQGDRDGEVFLLYKAEEDFCWYVRLGDTKVCLSPYSFTHLVQIGETYRYKNMKPLQSVVVNDFIHTGEQFRELVEGSRRFEVL